jgi:catabolite regulation protein CreA
VAGGFGWWVISLPDRGPAGEVSASFRWLGVNDKIVVDSLDDPNYER